MAAQQLQVLQASFAGALSLAGSWQPPKWQDHFGSPSLPLPFGKIQLPKPAFPWARNEICTKAESGNPAVVNLSGTWIKDRSRSDSMDEAIKLMRLNAVMRQAVRLVKGMRIKQDASIFEMAVFSYIGWFKVVERYALSGAPSRHRRRDFRRGQHTGSIKESDGAVVLELKWDDPLGGTGQDTFSLAGPDELHVCSTLNVQGIKTQYSSFYKRKK